MYIYIYVSWCGVGMLCHTKIALYTEHRKGFGHTDKDGADEGTEPAVGIIVPT